MTRMLVRNIAFRTLRSLRVAAPSDWLSVAEHSRYDAYTKLRRREAWLTGRRIAKSLIAESLQWKGSLRRLHLESVDGQGRPTRPIVYLDGKRSEINVSISHNDHQAVVALGKDGWHVGCDVEASIEPTESFAKLWLGKSERTWEAVGGYSSQMSILWAMKEACYKALGGGLAFAPRRWDSVAILKSLNIEVPSFSQLEACGKWHARSDRAELLIHLGDDGSQVIVAVAMSPSAVLDRSGIFNSRVA